MLNDIDTERQSRMLFMSNPDNTVINSFELELSKLNANQGIQDAWQYAQSLDYQHPGQSKSLYLAHPLRVATMYMQLVEPILELGIMTALIHNVQEVAKVTEKAIADIVGKEVAAAVTVLTVDRELQWDDGYKSNYYYHIGQSRPFVQQVKVLDKLDNMFLLCLNPDADVRKLYLSEIEKWVLPIARNVLPNIYDYIVSLIENNKAVGHMANEHKSLTCKFS